MKMSPVLLVGWLALERRWEAMGAALVTIAVVSLLSLGLVGPEAQQDFYGRVLPGLGAGDYNGLVIKIGMFGNHSWPNLAHQLWPAESGLSAPARMVSALGSLALVTGIATWFSGSSNQQSARFAVVLLAMLILPVYTYEHHLLLAVPALVVCVLALAESRLHPRWAAPVGMSWAVVAFPLPYLKTLATWIAPNETTMVTWLIQELPFASLCVLLAATLSLSRGSELSIDEVQG